MNDKLFNTKIAPFFDDIKGIITLEQALSISLNTGFDIRSIHIYALQNGVIPARYQRNIGTVGTDGQAKLLQSASLVIGAGGLGGNVIEQLARMGVGKIIVADFDKFDQTNLNRQLLSSHASLGEYKASAAEKRVREVNSDVECIGYVKKLDELDSSVFDECDIVFDCLDNVPDRFVLADRCAKANTTLIHAAIASWYAQIAVVRPDSGMMEKIYKGQQAGGGQSAIEKKLGTPPFTAAAAASMMVAQGVKVLTGQDDCKEDCLLSVDLLGNEVVKVLSF